MVLYDEKGDWTADALEICSEISIVLEPILKKTLNKEMSHSDFLYMVCNEVELLILADRRNKKKKNTTKKNDFTVV